MAGTPPWLIIQIERAIFSKKSRVYAHGTTLSPDLSRCHSLAHVWTIDNVSQKLTDKKTELISETFPCPSYDFEARARLTLEEDDCLYISLKLTNLSPLRRFNLAKTVFLRLAPTITYVLTMKEIDNGQTMTWVRTFQQPYKAGLRYDKEEFKTLIFPSNIFLDPSFKIEDNVVLEIHVEPHSLARQVNTEDGVLSWKIPHYSSIIGSAKRFALLYTDSPYFYSSPQGFRLLVRIFLNRNVGEEKGLVAYVTSLRGRFDKQLEDEFVKSVTFILYNPKDPSKSIEIRRNKENHSLEIPLATHAQIERDGFIKNDTLLYKVIVTTSQTNYSKISKAMICIS